MDVYAYAQQNLDALPAPESDPKNECETDKHKHKNNGQIRQPAAMLRCWWGSQLTAMVAARETAPTK